MSTQKAKTVSGELTVVNPILVNMALPALKISVAMGADTTPDEAISAVDTLFGAMDEFNKNLCSLRVAAGHMIREIKDRELYRPRFDDFEGYKAYLAEKHGLSRTVVQDALLTVTIFPKIKAEDVKDMKSVVNLANAARAARHMEPKDAQKLLKEASKMSVLKFREKLEDDGLLPKRGRPDGGRRSSGPVLLRILVPASLSKRFKDKVAQLGVKEEKFFRTLLDLADAQVA